MLPTSLGPRDLANGGRPRVRFFTTIIMIPASLAKKMNPNGLIENEDISTEFKCSRPIQYADPGRHMPKVRLRCVSSSFPSTGIGLAVVRKLLSVELQSFRTALGHADSLRAKRKVSSVMAVRSLPVSPSSHILALGQDLGAHDIDRLGPMW